MTRKQREILRKMAEEETGGWTGLTVFYHPPWHHIKSPYISCASETVKPEDCSALSEGGFIYETHSQYGPGLYGTTYHYRLTDAGRAALSQESLPKV